MSYKSEACRFCGHMPPCEHSATSQPNPSPDADNLSLQRWLAEQLKEEIEYIDHPHAFLHNFFWLQGEDKGNHVRPTEWDNIVHRVEERLTEEQWGNYRSTLEEITFCAVHPDQAVISHSFGYSDRTKWGDIAHNRAFLSAPWTQRARALQRTMQEEVA